MPPIAPETQRKVGFALVRIVVPIWILMGVVFKLAAGSPTTLPRHTFVDPVLAMGLPDILGMDPLGVLLYTLIGLEILAVAVLVFLARLAWPMAVFMLSVFCLVLIHEMVAGAETCGCFGGVVPVEPWQMLLADGLLLFGVIMFRPGVAEGSMTLRRALPAAGGFAVAGLVVSFAVGAAVHRDSLQDPLHEDDIERADEADRDPTINPAPRPLPTFWYPRDVSAWIGRPWRDLEIFQFMPRWPQDMDEGTRYVVFYSRTCGHCQEMFEFDLTQPLPAPLTAIEIPASPTRVTSPDAWPMPPGEDLVALHEHLHLPLGSDWNMITAPLALRIEDGFVTCAEQGEHLNCLQLQ